MRNVFGAGLSACWPSSPLRGCRPIAACMMDKDMAMVEKSGETMRDVAG